MSLLCSCTFAQKSTSSKSEENKKDIPEDSSGEDYSGHFKKSSIASSSNIKADKIKMSKYDLIVIGAGSGGQAVAKRAAQQYGKKVLLLEREFVGGTCVSVGCVPKKVWHGVAHFQHHLHQAKQQGWVGDMKFEWSDIGDRVRAYVKSLNERHELNEAKAGVELVFGEGKFKDSNTVVAGDKEYTADKILIATGSWANRIPGVPGSEEYTDTSYEFFTKWNELPAKVAVMGGGYIAVEMAGILKALGAEVHIIIRADKILRGFDEDVRTYIQNQYTKNGIIFHTKTNPTKFEQADGSKVTVSLDNGETLVVDKVLQAVGRKPLTSNLDCANANVELDGKGAVKVNYYGDGDEQNLFQSVSNPSVYAIGDVIDHIALTPVAIAQGRYLCDMLYGKGDFVINKRSYDMLASAVFSMPEIGTCGLSQGDAEKKYGADKIGVNKLEFPPTPTALLPADEKKKDLLKLVYLKETEEVLGCHLCMDGASEIIQAFGVALMKGITKKDMDLTMALHPCSFEELVTLYDSKL